MDENKVNNLDLINGIFSHVILGGTAYEIGQQLAELIYTRKDLLEFFTRANYDPKTLDKLQVLFNE